VLLHWLSQGMLKVISHTIKDVTTASTSSFREVDFSVTMVRG
jgi:hypothetical protein